MKMERRQASGAQAASFHIAEANEAGVKAYVRVFTGRYGVIGRGPRLQLNLFKFAPILTELKALHR